MFKDLTEKIKHQGFIKALTLIVGGTAFAQVLNFLFQTVITRLYSPEEFGAFALFTSSISILCVVVTLCYEQAIVASTDNDDAQSLMFGTIYISSVMSLVILLLVTILKNFIMNKFGIKYGGWMYFVPFNLFAMSVYTSASGYNYRLKKHKNIATSAIIRVIVLGFFQIVLYFVGMGYLGLVIGNTLSLFFGALKLIKNIIDSSLDMNNAKLERVVDTMKIYKEFPMYQLPSSFVNHFTSEAITYAILVLYTTNALGMYSLVNRMLSLPITVISDAARQLCISKVIEDKENPAGLKAFYKKVALLMGMGITIPFIMLLFWGEKIFTVVFGNSWIGAGKYITAMAMLYIIRFIVYPISGVAVIFKKQRVIMFFQIALITSVFISLKIAKVLCLEITQYLLIQSMIMATIYIAQGIYCYRLIDKIKILNG